MNTTLGRVAAHCGLRIAYYSAAALLGVSFLFLAYTKYRTESPLYILIVLAVMPSFFKSLLVNTSGKNKEKDVSQLPLFCKKYKYDYVSYRSMNISFFLLFILLAAWQFSYSSDGTVPACIRFLPCLTSVLCLLIRIISGICYRLYFTLFPLKAMR